MRPKSSVIWKYFSEIDNDPETVLCNICNQKYSRKGRGTSGMRSHLQSRHKTEYEEYEKCAAEKQDEVRKIRKSSEESPVFIDVRPKSSSIWMYFSKIDADTVMCNTCNQTYPSKGQTTSEMRSHLQSRHKREYEEYEKCDAALEVAEAERISKNTQRPRLFSEVKPKSSALWKYFSEVDSETVLCNICTQLYSRKGGGTSALRSHLQSRHKAEYEEYESNGATLNQVEVGKKRKNSEEIPLQAAKRQLTFHESLQNDHSWDTSQENNRELDDLICEMVAIQDLPLNFVNGIGFRRLMHVAQPEYDLKGCQYYTSHLCNSVYPKLNEKVKKSIEQMQYVSISTDLWQEPGTSVSLLTFTVHGIDNDFKRLFLVLRCLTIDDIHVGGFKFLAQNLDEIREEFKISEQKLHVMLRDDCPYIQRAARELRIRGIDCNVQQLEICISAALESDVFIQSLLAKCKHIAARFSHSTIAQNELTDCQERLGQSQLPVIQECPTRLISLFDMIERLIAEKDAIVLYTSKHRLMPQLSPNEWQQLQSCAKILKPIDEVIKSMTSATACISSVIPLIHVLTCTMQNILRETQDDCKSFVQKIIEKINNRFGQLHNNIIYAISTYLDPKYKTRFFDEITKERVESILLTNLIDQHRWKVAYDELDVESQSTSSDEVSEASFRPIATAPADKSVHSMLADMLDSEPDSNKCDKSTTKDRYVVLKFLLNSYAEEKRININEDSLLWWRNNQKYYELYGVARRYLSAPASSVPSGRLSNAGLVNNVLCNDLSEDTASKFLFTKKNLPLVNFDY